MKIDDKVIYEGCDLHVSFNLKGMKNLPEKILKAGIEVDIMTILVCCLENCSLKTMRNVLEVAYLKRNPQLPKNWGEKVLMEMLGEHIANVLPIMEKYFNSLALSERQLFVRVMFGIVVGIDNLKNGKVNEKNVSKCGPQPFLYQLLDCYELKSIWIPRWIEMWSILSLSLNQELTKQEYGCFQYIAKIDNTKSLFTQLKFLSEKEWQEKGFQSWEIANNYSECVGIINMFREQMESSEMQKHDKLQKEMHVKGLEDIKRVCLTNDISDREEKELLKRDISDSNAVYLYLTNMKEKEIEVDKYIEDMEMLLEKCFARKDFFPASYMLDGLVVAVDYLNRIVAENKKRVEDIFPSEKITQNLFQVSKNGCCLNLGVWANLLSMNELTLKSVNHDGFKIMHAKYEEDSRREMRNILMEANALNKMFHEGDSAKAEEVCYELFELWKHVSSSVNEIQDEALKRLLREAAQPGQNIKMTLVLEKREDNCPLLLMSFTYVKGDSVDNAVLIEDIGVYEDMALLGVEVVLTNNVYNLEPIRNRVLENQMKRDVRRKNAVSKNTIKILKF